jgi:hypothetical protein
MTSIILYGMAGQCGPGTTLLRDSGPYLWISDWELWIGDKSLATHKSITDTRTHDL